jgi:pimeloyl-ACP methyl ester carboxylesterase
MNPSDSYSAADVTVQTSTTLTYDQAVQHPETGTWTNSITTNTPAEQVAMETGYDVYGRTRTAMYFAADPDPNADPGAQTATVRTINNDQYTWNRYGQMVSMDSDDPRITDVTGTLVDAPVTQGLVTGDPRSVDAVAYYSISPIPGAAGAATPSPSVRPRVEQLSPSRVRVVLDGIEVSIPAAAPGARLNQSAGSRGRGSIARTYRKQNSDWILEEIRVEGEETAASGTRARHAQTMRFNNVRWRRNPASDEARRRRRAELERTGSLAVAIAPAASVNSVDHCVYDPYALYDPCEPYDPGGGGGGGSSEDRGSVGSTDVEGGALMAWRLPYTGAVTGTRLVVQHGFYDSGGSYGGQHARVRNALESNFHFDQTIFPTTSWNQTYETQAQQLTSILNSYNSNGAGQYVFVGYSNGGIISRQVGQWRPDLVKGLITVSSPHQGLPAMRFGRPILNNMLNVASSALNFTCNVRQHAACGTEVGLASAAGRLGIDDVWPVSHQMVPHSPYLQWLNSRHEGWRKISIEQHTQQRWAFWRVIKDLSCHGPEAPCGGREAVRKLDKTYKNLVAKTVVTGVLGFVVPGLHSYTVVYVMAVAALNAMDWIWDRVTSPGDGSDGVVPNQSQIYPNANRREVILNADSHDAAKKSLDKAILRLNRVLRDEQWAG